MTLVSPRIPPCHHHSPLGLGVREQVDDFYIVEDLLERPRDGSHTWHPASKSEPREAADAVELAGLAVPACKSLVI